ncbi:sporulation protein [Streptomyces libani]|uniref:sporulation protein n=1 Tax=Streptomyces TaxID=1883 RepID=UPI00224CB17B|nr:MULTISPECIES: sporulation protein [Streptomyces]MCX5444303.1 sporulation protein [Streptomyces libani]WDT52787.1 sporulation protein [Streptomyces sp. G7(2002)]
MTHTQETVTRRGNEPLERIISESALSHKRLAHRVNELSHRDGIASQYTHTSVANWCRRGMVPKWPTPQYICLALSEALGRPLTVRDIGMQDADAPEMRRAGLEFARSQGDALDEAAHYWSAVNRRQFLTQQAFAVSAFATPVTRWLVDPVEKTQARSSGLAVGRGHIAELQEAADAARVWDSRYGGAGWKSKSLSEYLYERVAPLLKGSYSEPVGKDLFRVTAELARLAGWTAFDAGQQHAAQRHFIQALRLARAGGDAELGSYILSTMAMQALMCGFTSEAIDMAQGAFQRDRRLEPRVAGFAKLIEARAHARAKDPAAASSCLAHAERLQERGADGAGPAWIGFFTQSRIITDAAEVFRDLENPRATFAWHTMGGMPGSEFIRSRAVRLSVLASAHAQNGDLGQSLHMGRQSLEIFTRLGSVRGMDYLQVYSRSLARWRREPQVRDFMTDVGTARRALTA